MFLSDIHDKSHFNASVIHFVELFLYSRHSCMKIGNFPLVKQSETKHTTKTVHIGTKHLPCGNCKQINRGLFKCDIWRALNVFSFPEEKDSSNTNQMTRPFSSKMTEIILRIASYLLLKVS